MSRRHRDRDASPLFLVATAAYTANCALGASVAARLIDTSRFRWLHHALYIVTCTTVAAAVAVGWSRGPRTAGRRAALALLPAAAPLAAIPYLGSHGRRHPLVALAAAPFIVAGLVVSRLPADRK
ncbi:hypothetical protein HCX50_02495 [Microbacterium oxydans]|uniref:hypothetical protein n=1 Tax=Microbacterium sp. B19(2022) TaxID=2914045 RepID=UPI00143025ED|nr:hypothetical protein [Microbacterium sp. B19(2022)]NJI58294.1 hypothetical protein [Microbacterium sp. B19(2022)]